jgi:hypothetical protein
METEMRRQFHFMISGVSNEESSFQSGYTGENSELIPLSGRWKESTYLVIVV